MSDERIVVEVNIGEHVETGASSETGMIFNVEIAVIGVNPDTLEVSLGIQTTAVPWSSKMQEMVTEKLKSHKQLTKHVYKQPETDEGDRML